MVTIYETCHLVLRINRYRKLSNQVIDAISEHNAIQAKGGLVNLTKFGRGLTQTKLNRINRQIKDGKETFLFLVYKEKSKFKFHKSIIQKAFTHEKQNVDNVNSPTYYKEIDMKKGVNFILSAQLEPIDNVELYMEKTNKPIEQVLGECRTALLFVKQMTDFN